VTDFSVTSYSAQYQGQSLDTSGCINAPMGPFAVCCYSVFKDHHSHPFRQGSRAAQGRDEVRNLTKSKQPVNNFLNPVILFTALTTALPLLVATGWLASNVTHPATAANYSIIHSMSIKKTLKVKSTSTLSLLLARPCSFPMKLFAFIL
jgi:hypothetical protein